MNLEKFTERSREFIQSAQSDALVSEHQRILPQHLLKVILDDEQEFAKLNAKNLMFCEDAARRIKQSLEAMPDVVDYWLKVDHQESLHAHNAVAIDRK